jgi:hypothetical protein
MASLAQTMCPNRGPPVGLFRIAMAERDYTLRGARQMRDWRAVDEHRPGNVRARLICSSRVEQETKRSGVSDFSISPDLLIFCSEDYPL